MNITEVSTRKDKKKYIDFIYSIYREDKNYCDMNMTFVRNFLYCKDKYAARCDIRPIIIEDGEVKLVCMFISSDDSDHIRLSFLEFLPDSKKYLLRMISYGRALLEKNNKKGIIAGINGQVSYGLGFLTAEYNRKFEFNSNYNPAYYTKELDGIFPIVKKAFSYKYEAQNSLSLIGENLISSVYSDYSFRYFDTRHFKKDMLILGDLCHRALSGTPYYSSKTPYEMYELLRQVRFIFKKEDVIFALKDGKEVGFVYTHPDYAEFFDKPKLSYISFFLRFLFKRQENLIYNVIGVLPEYQKSGLALGLIHYSIKMRQKQYPYGVSSFILEENIPSTRLCSKLSVGINKEYHLYEVKKENV